MKKKLLLLPVLALALSIGVNFVSNSDSSLLISSSYAQESADDEREVDITIDCNPGGSPKYKSGTGCLEGSIDCTPVHPCD